MEKIAVVGAGRVGRAWAIVFARAGHPVTLFDTAPGAADAALAPILQGLQDLRKAGLLAEASDVVASRVRTAETLTEAVGDADYVQENTPEVLKVKSAVFRKLDDAAPAHAVLASSTSTLRASQFSDGLRGRDRCLVAHPVNPPHVIPLVEISPAPWTRAAIVNRTRELLSRVGQSPVLIRKEVDGFVLNRLQAALLREAWRLVGEGVISVEDLDRCMKDGLGLRWSFMGPFETIDLNAPGGVSDYAARYGQLMYEMTRTQVARPWSEALIRKLEAERRTTQPADTLADRQAWRDRRLMALRAHQRKEK